jgi:hypothetical protein
MYACIIHTHSAPLMFFMYSTAHDASPCSTGSRYYWIVSPKKDYTYTRQIHNHGSLHCTCQPTCIHMYASSIRTVAWGCSPFSPIQYTCLYSLHQLPSTKYIHFLHLTVSQSKMFIWLYFVFLVCHCVRHLCSFIVCKLSILASTDANKAIKSKAVYDAVRNRHRVSHNTAHGTCMLDIHQSHASVIHQTNQQNEVRKKGTKLPKAASSCFFFGIERTCLGNRPAVLTGRSRTGFIYSI